jgi:hypothetical protein
MLRHACGYALANKGHDTRGCTGHCSPHALELNGKDLLEPLGERKARWRGCWRGLPPASCSTSIPTRTPLCCAVPSRMQTRA